MRDFQGVVRFTLEDWSVANETRGATGSGKGRRFACFANQQQAAHDHQEQRPTQADRIRRPARRAGVALHD